MILPHLENWEQHTMRHKANCYRIESIQPIPDHKASGWPVLPVWSTIVVACIWVWYKVLVYVVSRMP